MNSSKYLINVKNILILCCLFCATLGNAQEVKVTIQITTDNSPQHTKWYLFGANREYLAFQNEGYENANTLYEHIIYVDIGECLTFYIIDDFGNGLTDQGSFSVYLDNVLVSTGQEYQYEYSETFNCEKGVSCENAILIDTIPFIYEGPVSSNTWFVYVPTNTFEYKLTTCNSDQVNDLAIPDTQILIYDECKLNTGGLQGSVTIRDDDPNCSPGTTIEGLQLGSGKLYYINIAIKDIEDHDKFKFEFDYNFVLGCMDINSCNFNPFATVDDASCIYNDCTPDLIVNQDSLISSIELDTIINDDECMIREGCLSGLGEREVIRFTTVVQNIGEADYLLGNNDVNGVSFSYNNCHQHLHALGYAEYLLYAGAGNPIPVGFKNGFCISDLQCDNFDNKYTCEYMGISPGCADIYTSDLDCQWIDVTDIPDGAYTLVVRINWSRIPDIRGFSESNYENNWAQVCIIIDRTNPANPLKQDDQCSAYQDCMGVTFGQTNMDCTGVCGGNAHYGDINNDLTLNESDVNQLYEDIVDNDIIISPCEDLYRDGRKSIYDVALLQRCLKWNAQNSNITHNHCLFPTGLVNSRDTVKFSVSNLEEDYFDLYYHSPENNLMASSITFDGIIIDRVEYVFMENIPSNYIRTSENAIHFFSFREEYNIRENRQMERLARIYIKDPVSEQICIEAVEDIVNENYELSVPFLVERCLDINTSTIDEWIDEVSVFPSLVQSEYLTIKSNFHREIDYQLIDISGRRIISKKIKSKSEATVNLDSVLPGLYFLILNNGYTSKTKKIVKI